jgi:hypothetical protein
MDFTVLDNMFNTGVNARGVSLPAVLFAWFQYRRNDVSKR